MKDIEYYAHPAMSQSKLKVLLDNPRIFYLQYILGISLDKDTPSKNLGTCLDLALTDPEEYSKLQVKTTKTTSVAGYITETWKAQIDSWMNNLNNYPMNDSFFGGMSFGDIVKTCVKQSIIFYQYHDVEWRMKPDYLNVKSGFFIDLKSTRATSLEAFTRDFIEYGYHIQAASYAIGIKTAYKLTYLPRAYYIAVSTVTGEVFAVECSDQLLYLGKLEIDRGCEIYKHNLVTNDWAKDKPLSTLVLPAWKENQILNNYNNFFGVTQ